MRTAKFPKTCAISSCPIAHMAEIMGDYCTVLIVRDLLGGSRRYHELEKSVEGVSTRTLSKKLKNLEDLGIVKRTYFCEKPPRVEYSLTTKGKALKGIIDAMKKYAKVHI